MLIDLLSMANYNSYNVNLANIIGLHEAIYISELININEKAIKKNKISDEGYFTVDRKYITSRTTLDKKEQLEIDKTLNNLKIIHIADNVNVISIDLQVLTGIIMSADEKLTKDISSIVNKKQKRTKQQVICDELKKNIVTTNNELIDAYSNWIDSVIAKDGWMSKQAVISAQQLIDANSNRNLDVALKIISIASINGYRDMQWAVNKYYQEFKNSFTSNINTQPTHVVQVSGEVF